MVNESYTKFTELYFLLYITLYAYIYILKMNKIYYHVKYTHTWVWPDKYALLHDIFSFSKPAYI